MIPSHIAPPSIWTALPSFGGGFVLGWLYFCGLWWNVHQFTGHGHALSAICLMTGRFLLMAGVLFLASLAGAMPLLVMALGVLAARGVVTRRFARMVS